MIDLFRDHAADDAEVIGNARGMRKEIGDFLAALAVAAEFREWPAGLEHRILQLGELLATGERFRKGLTVQALQFRFPVEAFELRRTARHAEMDDAFDARRKVRKGGGVRPLAEPLAGERAEAEAGLAEKRAPGDGDGRVHGRAGDQYRVMVS